MTGWTLLDRYAYSLRHLMFNGRYDIFGVNRVDCAFAVGISLCSLIAVVFVVNLLLILVGVL